MLKISRKHYRCYALLSTNFALRANTLQAYKIANGEVKNMFHDLFPGGSENIFKEKIVLHKVQAKKSVIGARVTIGSGSRVGSLFEQPSILCLPIRGLASIFEFGGMN